MTVIVQLVEGLTHYPFTSLAYHGPKPPAEGEFLQALKAHDERMVRRWLSLVPDRVLGEAWIQACEQGDLTQVTWLYDRADQRVPGFIGHPLDKFLLRGIRAIGRYGHRELSLFLVDRCLEQVGPLITGFCVGGHQELFREFIPRCPPGLRMPTLWFRMVVRNRRRHMYGDVTDEICRDYDPINVAHVLDTLDREDRKDYTQWFQRPLTRDEIRQVLYPN